MRPVFAAAASAAAALTVAVATPGHAQTADTADFSGFRLEALAGYDNLSAGGDGSDGFVYGIAAGYDAPVGRARLGVEAEIADATTDARARGVLVANDSLRAEAGRDLYLGVRAGYVLSPRAMLYAKAGYTNARLATTYVAGTATVRDARNLDGFRLGAGVEYALSRNVYAKAEYRYSHYGEQDGIALDADRHQLMAGVGVRF